MNMAIKSVKNWLGQHPKTKQWAWFITLWFGGLMTVMVVAYPIKWIIKSM
jgi:uncharacterized membrane protein